MFLTYGFSAKRASGYGVAQDKITGIVTTAWAGKSEFGEKTFAELHGRCGCFPAHLRLQGGITL